MGDCIVFSEYMDIIVRVLFRILKNSGNDIEHLMGSVC